MRTGLEQPTVLTCTTRPLSRVAAKEPLRKSEGKFPLSNAWGAGERQAMMKTSRRLC